MWVLVLTDRQQAISRFSNWATASNSVREDTDLLFSAVELGVALFGESPTCSLFPNPAIKNLFVQPCALSILTAIQL